MYFITFLIEYLLSACDAKEKEEEEDEEEEEEEEGRYRIFRFVGQGV